MTLSNTTPILPTRNPSLQDYMNPITTATTNNANTAGEPAFPTAAATANDPNYNQTTFTNEFIFPNFPLPSASPQATPFESFPTGLFQNSLPLTFYLDTGVIFFGPAAECWKTPALPEDIACEGTFVKMMGGKIFAINKDGCIDCGVVGYELKAFAGEWVIENEDGTRGFWERVI